MRQSSYAVAAASAGGVFALSMTAGFVVPSVGPDVAAALVAGVVVLFLHHWKQNQFEQGLAILSEIQEVRAQAQVQDPCFDHALPWSRWSLPARTLQEVVTTVLIRGAKTVVECGSGVSTLHLARLFRSVGAGHVHALEHDERWGAFVEAMLERHDLSNWATVVQAPVRPQTVLGHESAWYELPDGAVPPGESIDVLLVDGPVGDAAPLSRLGALPHFHERLAKDAVVYLDDAVRDEEKQIGEIWCREYGLKSTYVDTIHGLLRFERK